MGEGAQGPHRRQMLLQWTTHRVEADSFEVESQVGWDSRGPALEQTRASGVEDRIGEEVQEGSEAEELGKDVVHV